MENIITKLENLLYEFAESSDEYVKVKDILRDLTNFQGDLIDALGKLDLEDPCDAEHDIDNIIDTINGDGEF